MVLWACKERQEVEDGAVVPDGKCGEAEVYRGKVMSSGGDTLSLRCLKDTWLPA